MVDVQEIQLTYSDGYEAFARLWQPASVRGAVLYLHGIQSHGAWFLASAQRLADAGFAVLMPDRRGSGRNPQDRGHAPSAERLLADLDECADELRGRTGCERLHIVAVSWGGKLALAFADRRPERVASIALVAPGLFPAVDIPTSQKVRVGLSALVGGRALFDIPLEDPALFTAQPDWQEFIRTDELTLRKVSSQFLITSRRLDALAQRVAARRTGPPLCLFLAGQDRIINNHATREFVRKLSWPERRIIEYEHAHHTLEFEPDPGAYFDDLQRWLSEQTAAGA
ncbi:MAG TPA: alpha/beta fold hydrolase [Phycisphaerae bacterium]|nr:alpha/beta fold hydrolase [Phycisphaerae bacterium]HOM52627.1 alpha/beta fold hydrolase [Phycisphaerae bacterium]HON66643.1 alpha/beta fold hydrolase [Phycisphaerae bacterium]HOQ87141.1 alpha/beta fold hydrolase [Phycisphaerae bacterium]HPP27901.1 alpha/beta fold hydrolase [Phycisphaerae bacterium]